MKIFIPKEGMAFDEYDVNTGGDNNKSLHAIKDYPEEEVDDD